MRFSALSLLAILACALACEGSPVGESGVGGAAGAATGGAAGGLLYGPGPHGALPNGYCCGSDQDCRYRTCLDTGGVKICSDPCTISADACNTAPNTTMCDQSAGQCVPSGAPVCIPADEWPLGERQIGDCCTPTFDGLAGKECQGNLCIAFGDISNPYICSHACDQPKDCPVGYQCILATGFCWPLAELYDCE